mmetsp:Transcript_44710/g.115696  ORF Transcript_44710/g.115696 Transcript_44710/m.115696 type:complete len:236 (+) Transcript_44710:201-908(+)
MVSAHRGLGPCCAQGAGGLHLDAAPLALQGRATTPARALRHGPGPPRELGQGLRPLRPDLRQEGERGVGQHHRRLRVPGRGARPGGQCRGHDVQLRPRDADAAAQVPPDLLRARQPRRRAQPVGGAERCLPGLPREAPRAAAGLRRSGDRRLPGGDQQGRVRGAALLVVQRGLRQEEPVRPEPQRRPADRLAAGPAPAGLEVHDEAQRGPRGAPDGGHGDDLLALPAAHVPAIPD